MSLRCTAPHARWVCGAATDRVFYVVGVDGCWPVCGPCGRQAVKYLMWLFPGHGIYTRKAEG